jgi:cell division protein FtsA
MIISALDIGTSKIDLVIGKKDNDGQLKILYCCKKEIDLPLIENISKIINSMINEAEIKTTFKINEAFISFKDRHAKSILYKESCIRTNIDEFTSEIDVENLKQTVVEKFNKEDETVLHFFPQEFIIDNMEGIQYPYGMSGICFESVFLLILVRESTIKKIQRILQKTKLTNKTFFLNSLASAEAVLTEEEICCGVLLIDFGSNYSEIAIYSDGLLRYFAVIPYGGYLITDEIQKTLKISYKEAERIKKEVASAIFIENTEEFISVSEILGDNFNEISLSFFTQLIRNQIDKLIHQLISEVNSSAFVFQSEDLGAKTISKIVCCGGGAMIKNLAEYIEYKTGITVKNGNPALYLSSYPDEIKDSSYSSAVGLLIKELKLNK